MPNHNSAEKYLRQTKKRNLLNRSRMSMVKTLIKKTISIIESDDHSELSEAFKKAQSNLAKCVKTGLLKKNTAARRISKLHKKVKQVSESIKAS